MRDYSLITAVRHGESTWNRDKIVQGQNDDAVLTEDGWRQARECGVTLTAAGFVRIIASDLRRTRETADALNESLQLPISYDPRLRERSYGVLETGASSAVTPDVSGFHDGRIVSLTAAPANGESLTDLFERVGSFLDDLFDAGLREPVLLVTHGGTIRALVAHAAGVAMDQLPWGPVKNCTVWPLGR
ncbi:MAG: phosphoglycerate mutase family protein [Acidobacteria bacterium]|nr:phosphoglycerate mutase family protein [Acidobacteriota bacterium]